MRLQISVCVALFVVCASTLYMVSPAASTDRDSYQAIADGARWGWQPGMSDPLGCVTQCGSKYDIRLLSAKRDRNSLVITVLLADHPVYSWQGHRHSVFRILGDTLYYARFHPSASAAASLPWT